MRQIFALLACLAFAATGAADTITSEAVGDVEGTFASDFDSTSTFNDPILAEVLIPVVFPGIATARAGQNITVIGAKGAVQVDGIFANGSATPSTLRAVNTLESVAPTAGNYFFSMFLTGARLQILDFAGGAVGLAGSPIASFAVSVDLVQSSSTTNLFSAAAVLEGGFVSHALTETGEDLGGTFFANSFFDFGYDFDPLFRNFDLGALNGGDRIVYTMEVFLSAAGFELGGAAIFGDPNDLDGAGSSGFLELVGGGGGGTDPVPEPSTLVLLGAVVISVAYRRRRTA